MKVNWNEVFEAIKSYLDHEMQNADQNKYYSIKAEDKRYYDGKLTGLIIASKFIEQTKNRLEKDGILGN